MSETGPAPWPAPQLRLPSPLPVRRLLPPLSVSGHIKARASDFLVDELALYEPCGTGEHLYLRIGKTDLAHHEMMSVLRSHFGVSDRDIGFAGMKDRTAVTSQTVSIHLPRRPEMRSIRHDRLQVLWADWHTNKLRRGHLAGNRFSIRIRGIEPFHAPAVWRALQSLVDTGVPDYFGSQRFGARANGHLLGCLVLQQRWTELVAELLGCEGSAFPEWQREARELAQAGRFGEALERWSRTDHAERSVLRALAQGAEPSRAIRMVPRDAVAFWVSAWQSAVYNRLLDQRLEDGSFATLRLGDVAWKHVNGARFLVDEAAVAAQGDEALDARAARFEISPTGVLPGAEAMPSLGATLEAERAAIAAMGLDPAFFDQANPWQQGARRPFRVRVSNPDIEGGADEHGHFVRVAFDLPAGAYATVVLRELGVEPIEPGAQPGGEATGGAGDSAAGPAGD